MQETTGRNINSVVISLISLYRKKTEQLNLYEDEGTNISLELENIQIVIEKPWEILPFTDLIPLPDVLSSYLTFMSSYYGEGSVPGKSHTYTLGETVLYVTQSKEVFKSHGFTFPCTLKGLVEQIFFMSCCYMKYQYLYPSEKTTSPLIVTVPYLTLSTKEVTHIKTVKDPYSTMNYSQEKVPFRGYDEWEAFKNEIGPSQGFGGKVSRFTKDVTQRIESIWAEYINEGPVNESLHFMPNSEWKELLKLHLGL